MVLSLEESLREKTFEVQTQSKQMLVPDWLADQCRGSRKERPANTTTVAGATLCELYSVVVVPSCAARLIVEASTGTITEWGRGY